MKSAKESWPPHPCEPEELGKTSAGYQTASIGSIVLSKSNVSLSSDLLTYSQLEISKHTAANHRDAGKMAAFPRMIS